MSLKTLITLATGWGAQHGGINSFNCDFLKAFCVAFNRSVRVICLVPNAEESEREDAKNSHVELRGLASPLSGEKLEAVHAAEIIRCLQDVLSPDTLWLGHDLFTGEAAVAAAKQSQSKAAVIHHMSYAAYESFKSGSEQAKAKQDRQRQLFRSADFRLAVGPLLRDALGDLLGGENIPMLIPGLPEIDSKPLPKRWTALLFGRLDPQSDCIKQSRLGVAALARSYNDALKDDTMPKALRDRPRVKLFGIAANDEPELRAFCAQEAGAVLDLHALPYTTDRNELLRELSQASVALMPSWHEGFGLVGWEAIGASIPLILSEQSGLYKFLDETLCGAGTGCIYPVIVRGAETEGKPYGDEDVQALQRQIKIIAAEPERAKRNASKLSELLNEYTWKRCAETFAQQVGWDLTAGGSLVTQPVSIIPAALPPPPVDCLELPQPLWNAAWGHPDSQLLRAEEGCVPFQGRESLLTELLDWVDAPDGFPIALRLHTGAGGSGKTRLMLELCQRMDASWCKGFLVSNLKIDQLKKHFSELLARHSKLLVVVDYAETRRNEVAALVEMAQASILKNTGQHLRLVLLARDAGDWWERMAPITPGTR